MHGLKVAQERALLAQPTGPTPGARRMGAPWPVTAHCVLAVARPVRACRQLPGGEADEESNVEVRVTHQGVGSTLRGGIHARLWCSRVAVG
jgi:hypothetical protein